MQSFCRALAVLLFLPLLPPNPATAAAAEPVTEPRLGRITVAPGGPPKSTALTITIRNVTPGTPHRLEATIDLGGATAFADVAAGPGYTDAASLARTLATTTRSSEERFCRRTGERVVCSWTSTLSDELFQMPTTLTVTAKKSAKAGDSATVTVATRVDNGPESTTRSLIQVGQGVDLVAAGRGVVKALPGRAAQFRPQVRNDGSALATGVVLAVQADPRLLRKTSFRNCRYGYAMVCSFDASLASGQAYAVSSPLVLRPPADTVPGSAAVVASQWFTQADLEDHGFDDYGAAGTGAPLTLQPVTAARSTPQTDVATTNDFVFTELRVGGTRRPAIAAAGVRSTATLGDHLTLRAGLENFGPGTFRPSLFPNNALTAVVELPANVANRSELDCDDGYCQVEMEGDLAAGQRVTFPVEIEVTTACGEPGRVVIGGVGGGTLSSAPLSVNVDGATCAAVALPITGPGVGRTAVIGLLLLVAGIVLTVVCARRPVCEHA
ncbi:hypothetical protein [Paractinoplanes brasiliensis]|uniref:DUF11 domain-containing protein n=1 Tax=Paractinoplanes brasiliensis TaxID=52695 RepID=A0A4R6JRS7_9ACTN|nr:hypothetical protein [Actinoplanes brasiliensis]TDO39363.1 hypothetical protein C8E87_3048 [Actinoplanes brasiliensis]GID32617.1 hypothetical protein Abr02nite_76000 [Actinoplanes brasiliensis]